MFIRSACVVAVTMASTGCSTISRTGNAYVGEGVSVPERNLVTAKVTRATRSLKPGPLDAYLPKGYVQFSSPDWDISIEVDVQGSGPAFGFAQWSLLHIRNGSLSDTDRWIIPFNVGRGWPSEYSVSAVYSSVAKDSGSVRVVVRVEDTSSRSFDEEVFSANLPLEWKASPPSDP